MESRVNFAVVGAFVLVLGALLVGGVLWLGSEKSYRKAYDTYVVYMSESVAGLSPDAPVRYRGVQVGRVRRIALAPGNVEEVQLTLDIERGTPIKQDTVAVLRTQGLTGIANVELSGGSRGSAPLAAKAGEEFPAIRSGPSFMLRLDSSVTALLEGLTRASETFNSLLDEHNREAFARTLDGLEVLSRTLSARASTIDAALASAASATDRTARLAAQVSQLVERAHRSAEAFDRMAEAGTRAGEMAAKTMESASAELRQVSGEALPEARATLAEMHALAASLRRLSEELERDPAQLIRGRPRVKPGPGE